MGHPGAWHRVAAVVGVASLVGVGVACGGGGGDGGALVEADVARVEVPVGDADAAVTTTNALGVDLYRAAASASDDDVVLSPYSVSVALAMARGGARGDTLAEMDDVLRVEPGTDLDRSMNALDAALVSRNGERSNGGEGDGERSGEVAVRPANALWPQADLAFEQPYLDLLATQYGAGLHTVDYKTDAEGARQEINAWVADQTEDRIPELLGPGSVHDRIRLVLTNALWFKAPWAEALDELGDQPFRLADGTPVTVPFMGWFELGPYAAGEGWQATALPYLGDELAMALVLPEDLDAFEQQLTGEQLDAILAALAEAPTSSGDDGPTAIASLRLPRFEQRSTLPLGPALAELGMPTAFTDAADFSGITTEVPLRIDEVQHEAFIAVDEEGTEAAAATAVLFEEVGGPVGVDLVLDRPFLFAVHDVETGAVLFLGRVMDPRPDA